MSDSTARHDYTPPPPATFLQPGMADAMATAARADEYYRHVTATAPTDEVPADPPPAAGPAPLLEGTFAIFVTPEDSIVVAYRPRGAAEDRHFVVPAFIVSMATQHSGHTPAEIFQALKDGGM